MGEESYFTLRMMLKVQFQFNSLEIILTLALEDIMLQSPTTFLQENQEMVCHQLVPKSILLPKLIFEVCDNLKRVDFIVLNYSKLGKLMYMILIVTIELLF